MEYNKAKYEIKEIKDIQQYGLFTDFNWNDDQKLLILHYYLGIDKKILDYLEDRFKPKTMNVQTLGNDVQVTLQF
jgi:hypothetical protein